MGLLTVVMDEEFEIQIEDENEIVFCSLQTPLQVSFMCSNIEDPERLSGWSFQVTEQDPEIPCHITVVLFIELLEEAKRYLKAWLQRNSHSKEHDIYNMPPWK